MFALDVAGEAGKLNCNIQIWQRTVTLRQGYGIAIVYFLGLVGWFGWGGFYKFNFQMSFLTKY